MRKVLIFQVLFVSLLLTYHVSLSYASKGSFSKYYNQGLEFYKQGKYDQARENFEKALELKPNDSYALYSLGNTHYCKSNYHESVKIYKKALKLNPDYSKAHYSLSLAYSKLGMTHEAEEEKKIFRKLSKGGKGAKETQTQTHTSSHHAKSESRPHESKVQHGGHAEDRVKRHDTGHHKAESHDAGHHKAESHDAGHQKAESHDAGHQKAESHDAGHHKAESHDTGHHKAESHDTGHHEAESHDAGHHDAGQHKKAHNEIQRIPATREVDKAGHSQTIFKGYSSEATESKPISRVFTPKHYKKYLTSSGLLMKIKSKWGESTLNKAWICTIGYILATQMWLCTMAFVGLMVWRVRKKIE